MSGKYQRNLFCFKVKELSANSGICQGKMKCCKNVREMSENFAFRPDEARMFGPRYIFLAKFIKFPALILSWKFEFMSGKSQGNVREFWSILNV